MSVIDLMGHSTYRKLNINVKVINLVYLVLWSKSKTKQPKNQMKLVPAYKRYLDPMKVSKLAHLYPVEDILGVEAGLVLLEDGLEVGGPVTHLVIVVHLAPAAH